MKGPYVVRKGRRRPGIVGGDPEGPDVATGGLEGLEVVRRGQRWPGGAEGGPKGPEAA